MVKLLDFGIAKASAEASVSSFEQTGAMLGTPSYMSPERLRARPTAPFSEYRRGQRDATFGPGSVSRDAIITAKFQYFSQENGTRYRDTEQGVIARPRQERPRQLRNGSLPASPPAPANSCMYNARFCMSFPRGGRYLEVAPLPLVAFAQPLLQNWTVR